MRHEIKIWPEYFALVLSGEKTFEIRRDDRYYCVGDVLTLREWNPISETYTGRQAEALVTHVLRGWGLKDGWVAMSIRLLGVAK